MKTITAKLGATLVAIVLTFSACGTGAAPASVASENLSTAADNFEIVRRIVFYNGITDSYMMEIVGACALGNFDTPGQRTVTCKTGPETYKKHFVGLSDNVTYFVEQLDGANVSENFYRVQFRPQTVLPDIRIG